jgi:hypothetical protein
MHDELASSSDSDMSHRKGKKKCDGKASKGKHVAGHALQFKGKRRK